MTNQNSFTSHFVELRSRLLKSIVFIFLIFIISYIFAEHIYNFLVEPYANAVKDDKNPRRLIFTALHETFITYLKVAFFAAIFLGVFGFIIEEWGFPVVTIVLGVILGPIIEFNTRTALMLSGGDWTTFISTWPRVVFIIIIVFLVVNEIRQGFNRQAMAKNLTL